MIQTRVAKVLQVLRSWIRRPITVIGYLDEASPHKIRGWAINNAGAPPYLNLVINGQVILRFQPTKYRSDLKFSRQDLGFEVAPSLPLKDGDVVAVTSDEGQHLTGSPKEITMSEGTAASLPPPPPSILDSYVRVAPCDQNAIDVLKGEWSSRFPGVAGAALEAGHIPLFEDQRIDRAVAALGGISGFRVLELGPLEGGHSYMLERYGAAQVIAVEANTRAYVKCLISKEILGLKAVKFLCGDFLAFLDSTSEQFDLILASGVLYHMADPVRLIAAIGQHTSRLYMWTHYWDPLIAKNPILSCRFPSDHLSTVDGFQHRLYRQEYQSSLSNPGFCGGSRPFSHWLNRGDLIDSLSHFGFRSIRVGEEQPEHQNGPALDLIATKESAGKISHPDATRPLPAHQPPDPAQRGG